MEHASFWSAYRVRYIVGSIADDCRYQIRSFKYRHEFGCLSDLSEKLLALIRTLPSFWYLITLSVALCFEDLFASSLISSWVHICFFSWVGSFGSANFGNHFFQGTIEVDKDCFEFFCDDDRLWWGVAALIRDLVLLQSTATSDCCFNHLGKVRKVEIFIWHQLTLVCFYVSIHYMAFFIRQIVKDSGR